MAERTGHRKVDTGESEKHLERHSDRRGCAGQQDDGHRNGCDSKDDPSESLDRSDIDRQPATQRPMSRISNDLFVESAAMARHVLSMSFNRRADIGSKGPTYDT